MRTGAVDAEARGNPKKPAEIRRSPSLARLMLSGWQQQQADIFKGETNMSNLQSFAGGALWVAVAAILMLATFEPVAIEQGPAATALQVTAEAPAGSSSAAI